MVNQTATLKTVFSNPANSFSVPRIASMNTWRVILRGIQPVSLSLAEVIADHFLKDGARMVPLCYLWAAAFKFAQQPEQAAAAGGNFDPQLLQPQTVGP